MHIIQWLVEKNAVTSDVTEPRDCPSYSLRILRALCELKKLARFNKIAIQGKGPDGKWTRKPLAYRESNIVRLCVTHPPEMCVNLIFKHIRVKRIKHLILHIHRFVNFFSAYSTYILNVVYTENALWLVPSCTYILNVVYTENALWLVPSCTYTIKRCVHRECTLASA